MKKIKRIKKLILSVIFISAVGLTALTGVSAAEVPADDLAAEPLEAEGLDIPDLEGVAEEILDLVDGLTDPENAADSINILILLTIIALAPSILVLMTGFTRILIVLSFVRNAMSLQQ
ncbi:MAG: hypothetical protein FWH24_04650, partial [Oscillospiraceae bacterium]|nr:hypothetical protein [Oscillospiraceae bacterium]